MNTELNEKLRTNLLNTLEEYLPKCKESLARNKHIHDFNAVDAWQPEAHELEELRLVVGHLIHAFGDYYEGGDRLGDVVTFLCDTAKKQRKVRPNDPNRALWDAVTVDFLNYWAGKRCMDLGLYANDLHATEATLLKQPTPHLQQIELYTAQFEYVATVEIPPFNKLPDVLLWGERFFRPQNNAGAGLQHRGVFYASRPSAYVECFAYASVTESPGVKRWEPPVPPPVDRDAVAVVGKAVAPGVPDTTQKEDGQQAGYVVLSDAERAKGFVRPVRDSYTHVGRKICGKLDTAPLTPPLGDNVAWACVMPPGHEGECITHRAVTEAQLNNFKKNGTLSGCGYVTSMGRELAETYARDPGFYGRTYCSKCKVHLPVGANGEFVWTTDLNVRVGT